MGIDSISSWIVYGRAKTSRLAGYMSSLDEAGGGGPRHKMLLTASITSANLSAGPRQFNMVRAPPATLGYGCL